MPSTAVSPLPPVLHRVYVGGKPGVDCRKDSSVSVFWRKLEEGGRSDKRQRGGLFPAYRLCSRVRAWIRSNSVSRRSQSSSSVMPKPAASRTSTPSLL